MNDQDSRREAETITSQNFLYEYTNWLISSVDADIKTADTKLATILGASGAFLGFSGQIFITPSNDEHIYVCYSCLVIQTLFCIAMLGSIIFCVTEFIGQDIKNSLEKTSGKTNEIEYGVAEPQKLIEKYYGREDERITKERVFKTNALAYRTLKVKCKRKNKGVKKAIICLAIAAFLYTTSITLNAYLSII